VITPKKWDQAVSHEEGLWNVKENSHDLLEEERQVNNKEESVAEADSHLNGKHYAADLESRIAAIKDVPKKSYASIVGSETRKGPIKIYVPANTSKAAAIKAEKQVVDSGARSLAQAQEELPPTATGRVTASENKVADDDGMVIQHFVLKISLFNCCILFSINFIEKCRNVMPPIFNFVLLLTAEGFSIYIGNLPPSFAVHQLETEFKKFGPIKKNGVQVRYNWVGTFCPWCLKKERKFFYPMFMWSLFIYFFCEATRILFWIC
jgi:hypothetical protein